MNKNSLIYKSAKNVYFSLVHFIHYTKRRPYLGSLKQVLLQLKHNGKYVSNINDLTIISSNCFAGRIMQDIGIEYNSPTLGLYFMYPDYIEFLSNIEFYLKEAKIEFVEHSKYPIGDERRAKWSHWYPIGLLDGQVEIHFLHYHSEEEAAEKWYRRCKRVNFNNLLIVGMQQNLCTEMDIRNFDKLPFENKIMFSTLPLSLESNEYMEEFDYGEVGDAYGKGHLYYRHLISHFSR